MLVNVTRHIGQFSLGYPKAAERTHILLIQIAAVFTVAGFIWLLSLVDPLIPPPRDIAAACWGLVVSRTFYLHLWVTIQEALIGLGIAGVLGIGFGVAIGSSKAVTAFSNPIILALYSVPKIVFLPILLMVFGVGIGPKIANAALHAVFPILLNALVATAESNALLLKAAKSMRATRLQIFRYVLLPGMVLPVFAGLKLGIGLGFLGALLAELFESTAGIAFLITRFYNEGRIADMLAVITVLIVIIVIVNAIMKAVENRLSRWRHA
jgi:NitT/TauT family transport system permease protein